MGAAASEGAVESLAVHLREGYSETALERTNRLEQVQYICVYVFLTVGFIHSLSVSVIILLHKL